MWRLLKLWRYITMSDKKYFVVRAEHGNLFSTYEEAELDAKKQASYGHQKYVYNHIYPGCYSTERDCSDYYIMESVALAKEPTPDVEVVKIV